MLEPLRVTHVVLSLDFGGLERVVLALARTGRDRGQDVSVLCLERPGTLAPQAEAMGIPVACVHKPPGLRWDTEDQAREVLRQFRPDVIHTHQIAALLYAGRAARQERVPVVHTEHNNVSSRRSGSWTRRLRTELLWRYAVRYANRFCGVSRDVVDAAGAYGSIRRRKLAHVPNGIDTAAFTAVEADRPSVRAALGIAPDAPVVGTVGRLAEEKQQGVLIRAFARVVQAVPTARLVLVGDGPLRAELEGLAASLGLDGAMLFTGYRPDPERYLAAMDVFVLPSRAEAMPLVILEAWAAGRPVVASRVGGIPELIEDGKTGLLVKPGDVDGLAARLRQLLADPPAARALGRAGQEVARARYDVTAMAGAYDRAYRELLTRRRSYSRGVLSLTNLYPNPFNPHLAPFNRHLLRLADQNPVRVISPIPWTVEVTARRNGANPLPADRQSELDGLPVDHPRYYFPPKVLQRTYGLLFEWSVQRVFHQRVAEFRPDLVYAPWAYPDGWAAVRLARRAGLPVVIQVLGSDVLRLTRHPGRRRLTFDALRAADGVVAVSRDLAHRVIEAGVDPDKVRVVYGGVDPARFHPGPRLNARLRVGLPADGDPVLLYVGRLSEEKGVDVLICACSILARAGRRFQCRIIGQGPLAGPLQAQIDRRGLGRHVRLLGARPQEDLPDWYRAADVFVLPSHSEGVPNVLLEATACGLPCVASRVGGVPEICDRGHIRMVPPADPTALAGAIHEVLAGQGRPRTVAPPRTWAEAIDELEWFLAGVLDRTAVGVPARTTARLPAPAAA